MWVFSLWWAKMCIYISIYKYSLQEQDFPEVSCQRDLSIQDDALYKMSCTVKMSKSPCDAIWHAFKGHAYNVWIKDSWNLVRQLQDRQIEQKKGHLMHIHSNVPPLTRAFKVTRMKKQNHNFEVPLFPLPDQRHPYSSSLCVFFPLSLSVSFTLLSLCRLRDRAADSV